MIKRNEIISLKNVSTVYEGERRSAIKNVDLIVRKNELVYIVGPNASGKTTLLETINGLLPTSKGIIHVFGLDLRNYGKQIRCEVGYVPQDFMVEPLEPYTAFDVVMMGRYGKIGAIQRPAQEDNEKAMELMELLEIEELADRPMGRLSGGQQQKVMIARALAKEPKILLLDEPFSNLDPKSRGRIPALINIIHKKKGLITLIATHDFHSMLNANPRIIILRDGRVFKDELSDEALIEIKAMS